MVEYDFNFFKKWCKEKLNIDLNSYKERQLHRRILTIMKSSGAENLREYAKIIENNEEVKKKFLDYITINVTEFFRNKEIFQGFEKYTEDVLIPRFKKLKIWSAACSIGAEPYSIAVFLNNINSNNNHRIIATDIDDTILEKAKKGKYTNNEIKNINEINKEKYFDVIDNSYIIKNMIRKKVEFKKHDLILDNYDSGFHVVLCRNVTIYFKSEVKNEIYKKISNSLIEGGIFFTGATESIYNSKDFGLRKISNFLYEKM